MNVEPEENYKLNGSDSWIHCIEFDFKESTYINYHYHEYIELLFFLDGEGIVWINGKSVRFTKNSLVIINSQRAHALDLSEPAKYICIKVMPNILCSNQRFCDEFRYVLPFISEIQNEYFFTDNETRDLQIAPLMTNITNEWNTMNYGFELVIKSNLLELFSRILRYLHSCDLIVETTGMRPEIKKAIMYVANNYSTVSEKEIAELCHLSYNHFSYLFKKTVGKNFKDYLLDTKIRQSEKLLLSTQKSITEIAQELNFSTTSHFITQFKKKNGVTPAKFRKILFS